MSNPALLRAIRPDVALALPFGLEAAPRSLVGFTIAVALGIGAALGASLFHRAASQGEVAKFQLFLPALQPKTAEIDLAAQGWPKALVSPNSVSFRAQVVARQPLELRVSLEGADDRAVVTVDGDAAGAERVVRVGPGKKTSIGVVFDVPPERRGEAVPIEAALVVVAEGTGRPLGRIPLRVIDSAHGATPTVAPPRGGRGEDADRPASAHTGHSGH